ncbi:MAG: hypothetical protein AAF824_12095 [Bacteroidota bacterium]
MKSTSFKLISTTLFLAALIITAPLEAQHRHRHKHKHNREQRTLFGNRNCVSHGGYGALTIHATEFADGENAILVGGRGAWVMNHGFALGLAGYGLVNTIEYADKIPGRNAKMEMGYGGLLLEPIILSRLPVHISIPTVLGVGWAGYRDPDRQLGDLFDEDIFDEDVFFVLEPGINLELNIIRSFRLGLNAQYRFTQDLDLVNTSTDNLEGWSAGVILKFGRF